MSEASSKTRAVTCIMLHTQGCSAAGGAASGLQERPRQNVAKQKDVSDVGERGEGERAEGSRSRADGAVRAACPARTIRGSPFPLSCLSFSPLHSHSPILPLLISLVLSLSRSRSRSPSRFHLLSLP
ncbi:hypothetical protein BD310DRAFT_684392 [Dichomitus squalens]|uniref:Uncharacterized protein n=1 Tax=Dichomitus squalens TaxID=114155 RepID=A0A4Q9PMH1_9APHY|nr:hypothetical protein BD310DRAFT_684392 [Dichomitus squalens]